MLDERYALAEKHPNEDWKRMDRFFKRLDTQNSAFISINWDTVIELKLEDLSETVGSTIVAEPSLQCSLKRGGLSQSRHQSIRIQLFLS